MKPLEGVITAAPRVTCRPIRLRPLPERPLVSVLMINFNYADFIEQAIRSVLDQTWQEVELVVVDDASTDASVAIVRRLCAEDPRLHLIVHPTNCGTEAATNTAYAHARGEILCLLDSDDWFHPEKLARVVDRFKASPQCGFIVHPMVISSADTPVIQIMPWIPNFERGWIAERLARRGGRWQGMPTSALVMRRQLADLLFPLPPAEVLRNGVDGYLYTLAPLLTEVDALDQACSHYRVHGRNGLAALVRDQTLTRKEVDVFVRHISVANRRLKALGLAGAVMDPGRNLNILRAKMLLALYRNDARWRLFRRWLRLTQRLLSDDLYTPSQRLAYSGVYAIASALPMPMRVRWIAVFLSFNPHKRRLGRLLRVIRHPSLRPAS